MYGGFAERAERNLCRHLWRNLRNLWTSVNFVQVLRAYGNVRKISKTVGEKSVSPFMAQSV
jgi:hypothetical protein